MNAGIVLTQRVLGKQGVPDLASFTKVVQVNLIGTSNAGCSGSVLICRAMPKPN